MQLREVNALDATRTYWVPAVVAPSRGWAGMAACHKGSRFMVHRETLEPVRHEFEPFGSELDCLKWIMLNRARLNCKLPGARVRAVPLDSWLLGLD